MIDPHARPEKEKYLKQAPSAGTQIAVAD